MIGLDGRDATARRPRGRREGVHAGLIPGSTDAKAQEEACDRSGRHRPATASRPRARRKGVHAGLILGGTRATARRPRARREGVHEESCDQSGRHRRMR